MRPATIAERRIGSVRKRSMMPVLRSDPSPTAVPIGAEVARFMMSRPPMAKSA